MTRLAVANVATLGVVLTGNGLAGSGALSGRSIGEIANQYPSYFLPADYVFGIWGLIYLGLLVFVVYQSLPAGRASGALERLGYAWVLNGALNVAWLVAFSFERFGVSLALMAGLLLNLIQIHARIRPWGTELSTADRLYVEAPFSLYLAWISVATIANTAQYLNYLGWSGFGIAGPAWAVIMMIVAAALAGIIELRRGAAVFGFVVAWALWGIGARFADVDSILVAARVLAPLCVLLGVAGLLLRRGRPSATLAGAGATH